MITNLIKSAVFAFIILLPIFTFFFGAQLVLASGYGFLITKLSFVLSFLTVPVLTVFLFFKYQSGNIGNWVCNIGFSVGCSMFVLSLGAMFLSLAKYGYNLGPMFFFASLIIGMVLVLCTSIGLLAEGEVHAAQGSFTKSL